MNYFDGLNNVELFATYAWVIPPMWDKVIGQAVTHAEHGRGVLVGKEGPLLRVRFAGELKVFCELEFFGSQIGRVEFTNIALPLKYDREYLIETLCYWELRQSRRYN